MKIEKEIHTVSVYVSNKPGALARIAQVFSRRGYNIESLVVSPAFDGNFSRMTIGFSGSADGLDQIIKQVDKLVDVFPVNPSLDFSVTFNVNIRVVFEPKSVGLSPTFINCSDSKKYLYCFIVALPVNTILLVP